MAKTAGVAEVVRENSHGRGCAGIGCATFADPTSRNNAQPTGRIPEHCVAAERTEELGEAMKGIDVAKLKPEELLQTRGW